MQDAKSEEGGSPDRVLRREGAACAGQGAPPDLLRHDKEKLQFLPSSTYRGKVSIK